MANLNGFDASTVDPVTNFEPLPAGRYLVVITESEMKATKNGDGHYLELTFKVIDGQYKNRMLWSRLNLDNPNPQAVQIAQAELSAICRAVGVMRPQDSIELHNLPLIVTVTCKKREDTGDLVNEVRGYAKKGVVMGEPRQETTTSHPWSRS